MKIYQAKINGVIELEEDLEMCDHSIALEQCCIKRVSTNKKSEDDKEYITYHLENLGKVTIIKEKDGKPVLVEGKAKKMTKSQIWRFIVEKTQNYDEFMNRMIAHQDEIIDLINNK